jgi:HEAT repeat protein
MGLFDNIFGSSGPGAEEVSRLHEVVEQDTRRAAQHADVLYETVDHPDDDVRKWSMYVLAQIGTEYPQQVLPAVDSLQRALDDPNPEIRDAGLRALSYAASADSDVVLERGDRVRELFRASQSQEVVLAATRALSKLATEYPEEVWPLVDDFRTLHGHEKDRLSAEALGVLAVLASDRPGEMRADVPAAIHSLNHETAVIRLRALSLLENVSMEYPEEVDPMLDELPRLLEDGEGQVRTAAVQLITNLALVDPERVLDFGELLEDRVTDPGESEGTSAAAAIALGVLAAHDPTVVTWPGRVREALPHPDTELQEDLDEEYRAQFETAVPRAREALAGLDE